jgi:hypothetical protein
MRFSLFCSYLLLKITILFIQEELTEEESGWKMIHGDVFRSPPHLNLFAAFIGAGAQIFFTILILLACVLIGAFKATRRGALLTALIVIYAICGVLGGMIGARIFKQLKGKDWVWNTVLTASMLPVPLLLVFSWVNSIAWSHESTAALPVTTITVLISLITLDYPSNNNFFIASLYSLCARLSCSFTFRLQWLEL